MRARHHAERRDLWYKVVEIVEHSYQHRARAFKAENFGAVGLAIGVEADAGVTGLGASIAVVHEDHFVAQKFAQERERRRVAEQGGDFAAVELDVAAATLAFAVIDGLGLERSGDGFEAGDVVGVEQVG